ncbi:hypothetical protein GW17_00050046 [Ensete ventricosum]|nr:hypothetical protein GW17_00050046 [Ensete ventricosum]
MANEGFCIEDLLHWRCLRADCEGDRSRGRRKCGWKRRKKVLLSIFRSKKKLTMSWDVLSFDSEEMRALLYLCKKSWPVRAAARAGEGYDRKVEMARLDSVAAVVASRGLLLLLTTTLWLRPMPEEVDSCVATVESHG